MTKADKVIDKMKSLLPEQVGKSEPEGTAATGLKPNDNVTYKKGHEFEGELGRVVDLNKDGSVNLKLGSSTRTSVPAADLLKTVARSV